MATCWPLAYPSSLICGGETFHDVEDFGHAMADWFKTFLSRRLGISTHDAFNRVLVALKPESFQEIFIAWIQTLRATLSEEIGASDGKVLDCGTPRASSPARGRGTTRRCRANSKCPPKPTKSPACCALLHALELSGAIVILGAMGCRKEIAREIKETVVDYMLALKRNQGRYVDLLPENWIRSGWRNLTGAV